MPGGENRLPVRIDVFRIARSSRGEKSAEKFSCGPFGRIHVRLPPPPSSHCVAVKAAEPRVRRLKRSPLRPGEGLQILASRLFNFGPQSGRDESLPYIV